MSHPDIPEYPEPPVVPGRIDSGFRRSAEVFGVTCEAVVRVTTLSDVDFRAPDAVLLLSSTDPEPVRPGEPRATPDLERLGAWESEGGA